jgi:hypothetical protein
VIRKQLALLAIIIVVTSSLRAQDTTRRDPHEVQPDRPTVATQAGTVAPGWIEIEAGIERDDLDGSVQYLDPINAKLGIDERVHLSLSIVKIQTANGFNLGDITLGLKYRLIEGDGLLGNFAVLPSVKLPSSYSSNSSASTFDLSMLLISSHVVNDVAIDLNVGYTVRTGDGSTLPKAASMWAASFGGSLISDFGWVIEAFGFPGTSGFAGQPPSIGLLFGPTYQLHPWLAFDAGAILPVEGPQLNALYVGVVWNVGKVWER